MTGPPPRRTAALCDALPHSLFDGVRWDDLLLAIDHNKPAGPDLRESSACDLRVRLPGNFPTPLRVPLSGDFGPAGPRATHAIAEHDTITECLVPHMTP